MSCLVSNRHSHCEFTGTTSTFSIPILLRQCYAEVSVLSKVTSLLDYNAHTWKSNYGCLVYYVTRTLHALFSRTYLCPDVPSVRAIPLTLSSSWNEEATTGLLDLHSRIYQCSAKPAKTDNVYNSLLLPLVAICLFLHESFLGLGRCDARFGPTPDNSTRLYILDLVRLITGYDRRHYIFQYVAHLSGGDPDRSP